MGGASATTLLSSVLGGAKAGKIFQGAGAKISHGAIGPSFGLAKDAKKLFLDASEEERTAAGNGSGDSGGAEIGSSTEDRTLSGIARGVIGELEVTPRVGMSGKVIYI